MMAFPNFIPRLAGRSFVHRVASKYIFYEFNHATIHA